MSPILLHCLFSDVALFLTVFVGMLSMIVLTCLYGRTQMHRSQFLIFWLLFLFSCGLACFHISRLTNETHKEQERILVELVRTSAETLAHEDLFFQARNTDENDPRLRKVRNLLASWLDANDDILSVYLLDRDDERIDVLHSETRNGTPLPAEWPSGIKEAFHGKTVSEKVVPSNRNASYFVAEPLFSENGGVDSVLCLEIRDWSDLIVQIRTWPHIFFLTFVVFVIATQLFFIRRRLSANKLRDTRIGGYEKAIESLVSAQDSAKQDAGNKNEFFNLINTEIKRPVVAVFESSHFLLRHIREETPVDGVSSITDIQDREFFSGNIPATNGSGATRRAEVPDRLGPRLMAQPRWVDSNSIDRIMKGGRKLGDILDDLQLFVDFEWNRLTIDKTCFSPERMFHEFRNTCQVNSRESKGMTFLLEIAKPIPDRVVGDEKKIRYVLERFFDWIVSGVSEGHVKLICSLSGKELCLKAVDSRHPTLSRSREDSDFLADSRSILPNLDIPEKAYTFGMHVASRLVRFLGGSVTVHTTTDRKTSHSIRIPVDLPAEASADDSIVSQTFSD